jgi:hypothetical protein
MPNNKRRFTYAEEKLNQARSSLLPPHGAGGEDAAYFAAFELLGRLQSRDVAGLPEPASAYWTTIERSMDTKGLEDPQQVGTYAVRIAQMGERERREFSDAVDELAHWLSDYEAEPV